MACIPAIDPLIEIFNLALRNHFDLYLFQTGPARPYFSNIKSKLL